MNLPVRSIGYLVLLAWFSTAGSADGQALAKVADLNTFTTGIAPDADMTLVGTDLYFTCAGGGVFNAGTLAKYDTLSGAVTKVADLLAVAFGSAPQGDVLLVGTDLYFTCSTGGVSNDGTLCRYSLPSGVLTKVADLSNQTLGAQPNGAPVAVGNDLYFTCRQGGMNALGTLCRYTIGGSVTKIGDMSQSLGAQPERDPLVVGTTLYFTCTNGGGAGSGSIVRYAIGGSLQNVAALVTIVTGGFPYGNLTAVGTDLYFLASSGSLNPNIGTLARYAIGGSVTKVSDLNQCVTGWVPYGNVTLVAPNTLYFLTSQGCGSCGQQDSRIDRFDVGGTLTAVASIGCPEFINTINGSGVYPHGSLTAVGSDLYFVTQGGGLYNHGTVGRFTPVGGPTAAVTDLGPGCGGGAYMPALASTNPVVGQYAVFTITNANPSVPGMLFTSRVPLFPLSVGGGCTVFVEIASLFEISAISTSAGGTWSFFIPIPLDITLPGKRLRFQAALFPNILPTAVALTNGLELLFGY